VTEVDTASRLHPETDSGDDDDDDPNTDQHRMKKLSQALSLKLRIVVITTANLTRKDIARKHDSE
jgi:hypothetical protein